jgi:phosphatidylinositol alpha-mannosyltransferase
VAASDLDAFRRVLDGGGALFRLGDADDLTTVLSGLLDDPQRRRALAEHGRRVVGRYDWPVVAQQVLEVYANAIEVHHGAA